MSSTLTGRISALRKTGLAGLLAAEGTAGKPGGGVQNYDAEIGWIVRNISPEQNITRGRLQMLVDLKGI